MKHDIVKGTTRFIIKQNTWQAYALNKNFVSPTWRINKLVAIRELGEEGYIKDWPIKEELIVEVVIMFKWCV
jgi:hypothetical protein